MKLYTSKVQQLVAPRLVLSNTKRDRGLHFWSTRWREIHSGFCFGGKEVKGRRKDKSLGIKVGEKAKARGDATVVSAFDVQDCKKAAMNSAQVEKYLATGGENLLEGKK